MFVGHHNKELTYLLTYLKRMELIHDAKWRTRKVETRLSNCSIYQKWPVEHVVDSQESRNASFKWKTPYQSKQDIEIMSAERRDGLDTNVQETHLKRSTTGDWTSRSLNVIEKHTFQFQMFIPHLVFLSTLHPTADITNKSDFNSTNRVATITNYSMQLFNGLKSK